MVLWLCTKLNEACIGQFSSVVVGYNSDQVHNLKLINYKALSVGVSSYHDLINMHERPQGLCHKVSQRAPSLIQATCHPGIATVPFKKAGPKHALHYCDYQLPDHLYIL